MGMSSFYSEVTLALVAIALVLVDAIFWPRRSGRASFAIQL